MRTTAAIVLLVFLATPLEAAQYRGWNIATDFNLTLSQSAYTDNWAGSETGSMTWALGSISLAEKQILAKVFNKNTLKLAYGLTYNQDRETKKWDSGNNTTDLVDLESTFRVTLGTFVEPILAFRGITQFLDETDPFKDRAFNPLDLTESVGVARVFIKDETRLWETRVGIAAKQIIDRDALKDPAATDPSAPRETRARYEGGFELVNDTKLPLADHIVWESKLTVFQGLISKEKGTDTGAEEFKEYPDVNFENIFTSKVTTYIAVNLYVQLLYDRQIDRDVRIKQTLALALTYKLL